MSIGLIRGNRRKQFVGAPALGVMLGLLSGCSAFIPGDVEVDPALFLREGFSQFSLAGSWTLTNSQGQTRRAVFDASGELISFELPNDEVLDVSDGDTVEVLLTSFGALSFKLRSETVPSEGLITLHEFEGWFADDGESIRGRSPRVADDLTGNRLCDCNEDWIRTQQ